MSLVYVFGGYLTFLVWCQLICTRRELEMTQDTLICILNSWEKGLGTLIGLTDVTMIPDRLFSGVL